MRRIPPPDERIAATRRAAQARWAKNEKRIDAALREMNKGTKLLLKKVKKKRQAAIQKKQKAAQ